MSNKFFSSNNLEELENIEEKEEDKGELLEKMEMIRKLEEEIINKDKERDVLKQILEEIQSIDH